MRLESALGSAPSGAPERAGGFDEDLRGRVRVAASLAALDLVGESRVREPLHARLQRAMEERRARAGEPAVRRHWALRRPVLATELGVLLLVALLALVAPRSLAALVEPVVRFIERVRVGDHTQIVRSSPQTAAEVAAILARSRQQLANGQRWFLHTAYGGFGGRVPPGENPVPRTVASLRLLHSLTALRLQTPTCLHRGEAVRFDHAVVAPGLGPVLMFFGSGPNELLLAAFPIGEGQSVAWGRSVMRNAADGGLVTESPALKAEELSLDGRGVVWDPDTTGLRPDSSALRWEDDGVSYSLMGRRLTREEAVDLFLSLRPL
jgi:hypothetical protein